MPVEKNPISLFRLIAWSVLGFVSIVLCFNMWENVDANKIMIVQSPVKGKLTPFCTSGVKWQGFGHIIKYSKRSIYRFRIPVRFNDGGHGTMYGSVQYDMPLDNGHLLSIRDKFNNQEALETQLIQTVVNKAIYMTGPLMSSKESYAEKRNYLISYVEDQVQNGVYKTIQKEVRVTDAMTGAEKTATQVEILMKNGIPERQEESSLNYFGIRTFNFAIDSLPYDKSVEDQIKSQQQLAMDVQTAIAAAKKAEQNAITAEANGKAEAMKSKWEQEARKATAVTIAEKDRDSCKLVAEAAEYRKRANILEGQGEAEKKKLILNADGALSIKLEKWLEAQQAWADAFAKFQGQVVPTTIMGGNFNGQNGATTFMDIMAAKSARDLGLDMSVPKGATR